MSGLRAWQREALDKYLATSPRDFLAVATPGAGKTTFALRLAAELLAARTVDRVVVVDAHGDGRLRPLGGRREAQRPEPHARSSLRRPGT